MTHAEFIARDRFSHEELLALSQGNLVADPPAEFIRLPAPPMLMVTRVTQLERRGPRGRIVGEQDIHVSDWFFHCHFRGDPVQPGCLGVDAIWQLVGLYIAACGAPGSGRALGCKEVEFAGQIRPHNRTVRYEVDIRRFSQLKESGSAVAIGIHAAQFPQRQNITALCLLLQKDARRCFVTRFIAAQKAIPTFTQRSIQTDSRH